MATNTELRDLFGDTDLRKKIEVSVIKAAQVIMSGGDTASPYDQTAGQHELRVKWAVAALTSTGEVADLHKYVLAANDGLTVAQIQGANDSAIDSNVAEAVDSLATAQYGA